MRKSTARLGQLEADTYTLAEAIAEYAYKTLDVAERELQGAEARIDHEKSIRRYREKVHATRTLFRAVQPIIQRLKP